MRVIVDFETYYSKKDGISVTQQGNDNYVAAADPYIVSVVTDEVEFCGTIDQAREHFPDAFWQDADNEFYAANSNFDQAFAEKVGWKTAKPWKCVLDLGKFNQYPKYLAKLVEVVLKVKMDKAIRDEMDGVDYWQLPAERQQALIEYCLNDSVRTRELLHKLPPMTSVEDEIAAHTRLQNRRGVFINTDLVEADKTRLHEMRHLAFLKIPWHNEAKPLSPTAFAAHCNKNSIPAPSSLDKRDEECTNLMSNHPLLNEIIGNMRTYRRANTLLKKADTLMESVTPEGKLPLSLLYCGARHTRRWSSQGFNIQNLDREPVSVGNGQDVWSRRWIVPRPGKIFLCLDFSQIEPRCLNWLVGNEDLLSAIRAGYGIYEAYALAFKGWKGKPGTLKKENLARYTAYKSEVLGLGYGMGSAKYVNQAAKDGLRITLEESTAIVKGFRNQNPRITGLWRQMDEVVKRAVMSKSKVIELELPTGDYLRHFHVAATSKRNLETGKVKSSYRSFTIQGDFGRDSIQDRLWGGVLVENVVQRMARDVMAEASLNCEKAGLPVLWTSHDEVILELDDDASKMDARKEAEYIMSREPGWCEGLPLAVEGDFVTHYSK